MKKSTLIHIVSIISGIIGFFALLGAWVITAGYAVLNFTVEHCYLNAIIFMLISISAGVCALYRRELEREGI